MALSVAACDIQYFRDLLHDLGVYQSMPTVLNADNKGANDLAHDYTKSSRSRHIQALVQSPRVSAQTHHQSQASTYSRQHQRFLHQVSRSTHVREVPQRRLTHGHTGGNHRAVWSHSSTNEDSCRLPRRHRLHVMHALRALQHLCGTAAAALCYVPQGINFILEEPRRVAAHRRTSLSCTVRILFLGV